MLSLVRNSVRWLAVRLFGRGNDVAPITAVVASIEPVTGAAPAVAGFVYRLPPSPVDFHLSSRLRSVAHLNTPAGRVPAQLGRPASSLKPIPKLQAASRKRSPTAAAGRAAQPAPARSAQVVALPKRALDRCIPLSVRIAEAA